MTESFSKRAADDIIACCPEDCERNWGVINQDIDQIANMDDPLKRNERITEEYSRIATANPENRWAKLASYVSAQAGCGMQKTEEMLPQTVGRLAVSPEDVNAALADGNVTIFSSVAKPFIYVRTYGYESFFECADTASPPISGELQNAMHTMQEQGDLRDAADQIAEYEQLTVVEAVYQRHADTFQDIDDADTKWEFWAPSRDQQSIPVSHDCTDEGKIPLEGPLSDKRNRVKYYHALMDRLQAMEGW